MEKKLVAVMNKNLEPGVALNALGHMCLGFGAHLGETSLALIDYHDENQKKYPNISKMPFIILRATSSKIAKLIDLAEEQGIEWSAFTDTMTEGTWEDQLKRTEKTPSEQLTFFGVVLFGEWDQVSELTRKFSLWK